MEKKIRIIKKFFAAAFAMAFACASASAQKAAFGAGASIPDGADEIYAKDFEAGKTHSEAIEAAMEAAKRCGKFASVVLDSHDWLIDRSILVHSDMQLVIDGCKVKMKDFTHDTLIRCENLRPDPKNPFGLCSSAGKTTNFKITGRNGGALEGCDKPYEGEYRGKIVPYLGDYFGWRGIAILITEASGYEISNLKISKAKNWAISQEWCSRGYIHSLTFDIDVKNGDGIDFRNGCSDCVVENIFGRTGDDTVACTALGDPANPRPARKSKYIYPNQALGNGFDRPWRGIKNIIIRNIFTVGKHHAVICLATVPVVENIQIENICEPSPSQRFSVVKIYTGYGGGYKAGNLRNISVANVVSQGAKWAVELGAEVENVSIKNVRQLNPKGALANFEKAPSGVVFEESPAPAPMPQDEKSK